MFSLSSMSVVSRTISSPFRAFGSAVQNLVGRLNSRGVSQVAAQPQVRIYVSPEALYTPVAKLSGRNFRFVSDITNYSNSATNLVNLATASEVKKYGLLQYSESCTNIKLSYRPLNINDLMPVNSHLKDHSESIPLPVSAISTGKEIEKLAPFESCILNSKGYPITRV